MNTRHFIRTVAILVFLLSCSVPASVQMYTVTVGGDRLEFVPQPEKGYVVKTTVDSSQKSVASRSEMEDAGPMLLSLPRHAKPIGGLGRRGVYTVENNGPASANEKTIAELKKQGEVAYAAPLFSSNEETVAIIPEIVVRAKPGVEIGQLEALCKKTGCAIKKRMEFTQQEYLLEVLGPDAEAVFAAVKRLSQAAYVEWACPNTVFRPKLASQAVPGQVVGGSELQFASVGEDVNSLGVFPNDEYFPKQWHLHNTGQSGGTPGVDIHAPEAWEITTGDPNVVIAVLDTGVDPNHPDLVNNLAAGYDSVDGDDQPDPHGTACAGLIAAQGNNGIGVTGVAWNCKIMPVQIAREGEYLPDADIATAFRWAAANGADVLNNSWGFGSSMPILHSAIVDCTRPGGIGRYGKGCIVSAASHNQGSSQITYPAVYAEVIAVGATDHNDARCYYSNYGPELDVVAPGSVGYTVADWVATKQMGWLWTTDIRGPRGWNMYPFDPNVLDYTALGGTSGSCPIAAGVAALILSIEPNLTSDEVRHFLERSAKDLGDPGRDDYYGWGRVDARAALDMVLAKRADLNNDWRVDEEDRAILMRAMDSNDLSADIAPAARRDGKVDQQDLDLLTHYLGTVMPELGLVAHWKLDEAEGSVAYNATGDPIYNATLRGDPSWQPDGGRIGGALAFDGKDDWISSRFVVNPAEGPFSVFAWVKGGAPGQVIVSQQTGSNWVAAGPGGAFMTELKGSGRNAGPALASGVVITDGQWHRVGLVWDGSERMLFVDGVEVARDASAQGNLTGSTNGLYIGAGNKRAAGSFWSGLIDDVRIHNQAVKP